MVCSLVTYTHVLSFAGSGIDKFAYIATFAYNIYRSGIDMFFFNFAFDINHSGIDVCEVLTAESIEDDFDNDYINEYDIYKCEPNKREERVRFRSYRSVGGDDRG